MTILQRIAAGEQSAVAECLDQYGGLVWSLARRFLPNQSEAEDAVQEIFVELWRCAGRFDERTASESTFVAMIARRRLIDRRRRAQGQARTLEAATEAARRETESAAPDAGAMAEDVAAASGALALLPAEQQRVIRLSMVHGLTHEEIASVTGLPLGTVKTNIRRGLARVREKLAAGSGVTP